eukprot:TRINITY_DN46185_c0_g1_i1.p1 TRINITY_DN46185_c0_g1~~TRINITY_DN46185_c0_g1_i1.p1  ORF type:complete len:407 (+),score=95.80 TRINITY_DN46185_c0_g1_i1:37-1257(+)
MIASVDFLSIFFRYLPSLYTLFFFFFLMIRRPPRSTLSSSSAASDVYKRQPKAPAGRVPQRPGNDRDAVLPIPTEHAATKHAESGSSVLELREGGEVGGVDAYSKTVLVILACDRPDELDMALKSWAHVTNVRRLAGIMVSFDCRSEQAEAIALKWQKQLPNLRVWHSHQRDITEPKDLAWRTAERVARHVLDATTRGFNVSMQIERVIYTEEDHVVTKDILLSAIALNEFAGRECKDCFSINLGCHRDCWGMRHPTREPDPWEVATMESGNMGVVFQRKNWKRFLDVLPRFCEMYGNWDMNLHTMAARGFISGKAMTLLDGRIQHLPTCTSARTKESQKDCQRLRREFFGTFPPQKVANLGVQLGQISFKDKGLSLIHISEPTRLLSISYAVFCLKKKKTTQRIK